MQSLNSSIRWKSVFAAMFFCFVIPFSIRAQIIEVNLCVGENINLSTDITGTVTYQWQVSIDGGMTFTNLAGATWHTLGLGAATLSMNGYRYRCAVSDNTSTIQYSYTYLLNIGASTNMQDSLALVQLYNSTNGPGWVNNTGWLSGPVSDWYGVFTDSCRVKSVFLPANGLVGTLPPALGFLSKLTQLALNSNQLSGSIPAAISNLSKLRVLRLSSNQFSGSLPSLNSLGELVDFQVQNNMLEGAISINSILSNLLMCNLSENEFTFTELQPLAPQFTSNHTYSPQANFRLRIIDDILSADSAGGTYSYNTYKWFVGGQLDTTISGNFQYQPARSGRYHVEVKNSLCPDLTLRSDTVVLLKFKLVDLYPSFITSAGLPNSDINLLDTSNIAAAISADGVTKLILYTDYDENLDFRLVNQTDGSLSNLFSGNSGSTSVVITPTNGKIGAVFTAPDGIGNDGAEREVIIEVFPQDGSEPVSLKIRLVTPPVVLVHGMWSDPSVWNKGKLVQALQIKGFKPPELVDYSNDNFRTFDPVNPESLNGINAVDAGINRALARYRNQKIAATQVDVVAHSLGGLITRAYSQRTDFQNSGNYLKGSIHKLITLNTPHRGSPLGPALWRNRNRRVRFPTSLFTSTEGVVSDFLASQKLYIGSCHRDFGIDSLGLSHLTATPPYKTFSISSDAEDNNGGTFQMNRLCQIVTGQTLAQLMSPQIPCTGTLINDLIVPLSSQRGSDAGNDTLFLGVGHSDPPYWSYRTVTSYAGVHNKIVRLLFSTNGAGFGIGFPAPSSRVRDCNTQAVRPGASSVQDFPASNLSSSGTQHIKILSPSSGSSYETGDSSVVTIELEPRDGAFPTSSLIMIEKVGWFSIPDSTPTTVTVTIPKFVAVGKLNLLAFSVDSTGILMADTCHIVVSASGILDSLAADPTFMSLDSIHQQGQINVKGYFRNNIDTFEISLTDSSTGTSYSSLRNDVFNVTKNGLVNAVCSGRDTLVIQNLGKSVKIPVEVRNTLQYRSVKSGAWDDPSTWSCHLVPSLNDSATILDHHTVKVNGVVKVKKVSISIMGGLVLSNTTDSLIVGNSNIKTSILECAGMLHIDNGSLIIHGALQMTGTSKLWFNGGKVVIDGNGGSPATSVSNGINLFDIACLEENFRFTAGTLQFPNPPFGENSETINCQYDFGNSTQLIFGDGVSTILSNNPNGFGGNRLPSKIGKFVFDASIMNNNRIFNCVKPLTIKSSIHVKSGNIIQNSMLEVVE